MSIFRRKPKHVHEWRVTAVQRYWVQEAWIWQNEYGPKQYQTRIYYLCQGCQTTTQRDEMGTFSVAEAKIVFPNP